MKCKCGSQYLPTLEQQKKCFTCMILDECKKKDPLELKKQIKNNIIGNNLKKGVIITKKDRFDEFVKAFRVLYYGLDLRESTRKDIVKKIDKKFGVQRDRFKAILQFNKESNK